MASSSEAAEDYPSKYILLIASRYSMVSRCVRLAVWLRRTGAVCRVLSRFIVVRSKYSLTPKKLLQKVSQSILVDCSVLFSIVKVYQSRTPGKVFFFQDGVQDGRRTLLMIITM